MLTKIDVSSWSPQLVRDWLAGVCDEDKWIDDEYISRTKVNGAKLMMMSPHDLIPLGAKKVDLQERILEAIEKLKYYDSTVAKETLQLSILRLSCLSRSLNRQLVADRESPKELFNDPKVITLFKDLNENTGPTKQRVSLDTLATVSSIVKTVRQVTNLLNLSPFRKQADYTSMKSLLLALSIELTSTAQRDQFVERPNDIIEKSAKALADYCDRIVHKTKDVLLAQPFQLEEVRIRKGPSESHLGLVIKSHAHSCSHKIHSILPLSPAKKTNKLTEGDEIIQLNQYIIGWSVKNVTKLLNESSKSDDITLMVKKGPKDSN